MSGAAAAAAAALTARLQDLIDGLPLTVTLDIAGLAPAPYSHATPRRDDEMIRVHSRPGAGMPSWRGTGAGVLCGRADIPFGRLAARQLAVNPRSVHAVRLAG